MSSGFIPGVIGTVPVGGTTGQVLTKSSNSNYAMVWATLPPPASVMGPSGPSHAAGLAPDPGATVGATRYLREDATWAVPAGAGGGLTDPTTTKGDLIVRGTAAVTRLGVGTDGQILTADSTQATGVKWATAVASVFGRTGAVTAQAGDYTASQVTNAVSTTGSYSDPAWITGLSWGKVLGAPSVSSYQTPWLSDINAAGYNLYAVTHLGVGTSSPQCALDCAGMIRTTGVGTQPTSGPTLDFAYSSGGIIESWDYTAHVYTKLSVDGLPLLLNSLSHANVGVGTLTPAYALDVHGDVNISGIYRVNGVQIAAANVTNAVDSTGTYVNPSWIVSYSWTKITGAPAFLPDPTTTLGDIIVRGSAAPATRLAVGTNGQVLTADSSQTLGVKWATPTVAVSSVFGRTGAVVAQAGDYTAAQVTNAVSTTGSYSDPAWLTGLSWSKILSAPSFLADPTTTKGDLIARGAAAPPARLPVGADGQVLTCDSTQTLGVKWAASASAPVTSVFGRTGAVSASPGDYSAAQITNAVSTANTYSDPAWLTGLAWSKVIGAPSVSSYQTPWLSNINGATYTLTNVSQIGVAVASPTYPLEVYGVSSWSTGDSGAPIIKVNASSSAYIQFMPGNPYRGGGISFFNPGTPNTYQGEVGFDGYGSVRFISPSYMLFLFGATGGAATETMRVVSGRVGIGTTSPLHQLHIAGADGIVEIQRMSADAVAPSVYMTKARGTPSAPAAILAGDFLGYHEIAGQTATGGLIDGAAFQVIATAVTTNTITADLAFLTNSGAATTTERMRITGAGLVGIGTSGPQYALDVAGNIHATTYITSPQYNGNQLWMGDHTAGDNVYIDSDDLTWYSGGTKARWNFVKADAESTGNAGSNLYLQRFNDAGTLIANLLFFTRATGFVGIGAAASTNLDVVGTIRTTNNTQPTSGAGLEMGYITTSNAGFVYAIDRGAPAYKPLFIDTNPLYLNSQTHANVGIGTSSPAYLLDIEANASNVIGLRVGTTTSNMTFNGGDGTNAYINVPSWGLCLQTSGSNRIVITSGGNVAIGSFTPSYTLQLAVDSAAKPTTNTWTIPSDIRTKRNVNRFEGDIGIIRKLDPIVAEYNGLGGTPEGTRVVSFDAEKLRKILPQAVSSVKSRLRKDDAEETELLGINTHEIFFHLLRAVQQIDARLSNLEKKA